MIPLFLFSANLKYPRVQKGKKPIPYSLHQQIKPLNKAELSPQKRKNGIQGQVQSSLRQSPRKHDKEKKYGAVHSRRRVKKPLESYEYFRSGRRGRRLPYRLDERITFLKGVRSFRSRGNHYAPDQVLVKFKIHSFRTEKRSHLCSLSNQKTQKNPGIGHL